MAETPSECTVVIPEDHATGPFVPGGSGRTALGFVGSGGEDDAGVRSVSDGANLDGDDCAGGVRIGGVGGRRSAEAVGPLLEVAAGEVARGFRRRGGARDRRRHTSRRRLLGLGAGRRCRRRGRRGEATSLLDWRRGLLAGWGVVGLDLEKGLASDGTSF